MAELPEEYKKLIALGIDKSANLPDLNDMTDRSIDPRRPPLKPWTAEKTTSTMNLIRKYNITNEEVLLEKFQEYSKFPIEVLTDQVYGYQIKYFGRHKYDKATIFKYAYCCIIINSLRGNATELLFDRWAKYKGWSLVMPPLILDAKHHTDRMLLNENNQVVAFISIKPNLFSINYLQYTDVFAGLQSLTNICGIPWKIYYRYGEIFQLIQLSDLSSEIQKMISDWSASYSKDELNEIEAILNNIKLS
jgi:hypothetical protein